MCNGFSCSLAVCLTICLCIDGFAQQGSSSSKPDSKQATLFETLGDIKAFSKRMDNADGDMELTDAIVDLTALYLRVVGDSRFGRSEKLQGYRGRIAARLQKAEKIIVRAKQKAAKNDIKERYVSESDLKASMADVDSAVIDQQWRLVTHAVGGTTPSMYYASGMYGTSGHFYRGRAGGLPGDNGDELLDLIRTVLHPDFWEINGGSGKGYYYQPLRILVVRATMRVHEDIENLLERLR